MISFPINPINGNIYTFNNVKYIYDNTVWKLTDVNPISNSQDYEIETGTNDVDYITPIDLVGYSKIIPTGTILMCISSTIPTGYLLCNGGSFSSTTYPILSNTLGFSSTPDMSDKFVSFVGDVGVNTPINSTQMRALGSIDFISTNFQTSGTTDGSFYKRNGNYSYGYPEDWDYASNCGSVKIDASRNTNTASENLPKSYTIKYIIKHD